MSNRTKYDPSSCPIMSTNVKEKSKSINNLFVNFELRFQQLMLESKSNKVCTKDQTHILIYLFKLYHK